MSFKFLKNHIFQFTLDGCIPGSFRGGSDTCNKNKHVFFKKL